MKKIANRSKRAIWIPAAFCAMLSLMKMLLPNGAGDPAFYSFLPMCFFFSAIVHLSSWKRIEILEAALREHSAKPEE